MLNVTELLLVSVFPRPVLSEVSASFHCATSPVHRSTAGLAEGLEEGEALGDADRLLEGEGEAEGEALGEAEGLEIGVLRISTNPTAVGLPAERVKDALAELPAAL